MDLNASIFMLQTARECKCDKTNRKIINKVIITLQDLQILLNEIGEKKDTPPPGLYT